MAIEAFEPPKYIASLIAAINDGAKSAQLGALAFVAVGVFLLASTFSASDEDLLLNHSVAISQLGGVSVPVVFSFGLAPVIFLAAHIYTLMRYDMLAGNIRRFRVDLDAMVLLSEDRERCRQLLANVEFVQALVAPPGTPAGSPVFKAVSWTIIAWFPLAVLLIVQTGSLRLQHEVINWIHHVALVLDVLLLGWFAFFPRVALRRWTLFGRMAIGRRWRGAALAVMGLAVAADLAWLRVPGPEEPTLVWVRSEVSGTAPLLMLLQQPVDLWLCPVVKWGCRFLSVSNRPLTGKVWDSKAFVEMRSGAEVTTERLAGIEIAKADHRNLRFADLHGSTLFGADLTGAECSTPISGR